MCRCRRVRRNLTLAWEAADAWAVLEPGSNHRPVPPALFLAMLALIDPGDRVVCPDPRYTSYDQAIGAAGGAIVTIPTGGDEPFELSATSVRE